jgi:hypothetical protein
MSKQLTVNIVRDWDLPAVIIEPLQQYMTYKAMSEPSALTKILVESKLLSEISLLLEAKLITLLDAELILMKHNIEPSKIELLTDAVTN